MLTKKILVVDDEPNIVALLESRLQADGYDVISAGDGLSALNMARSENPDLIILDLMLPEMDGYKVCAMLKFDVKHMTTPIIMLTARAQESDQQMGVAMGADAYFVKPFDGKQLMGKVKELLR